MRIIPAMQSAVSNAKSARRSNGTEGFSLNTAEQPKSAAAKGAAVGIQSVDALMALQGVEDPGERRRRFAGRGRNALELLDKLKVEILDGRVGVDTLRRLEVMLDGLAERSGEPGLDGVLDAIGVRVAVEIAKRKPVTASSA